MRICSCFFFTCVIAGLVLTACAQQRIPTLTKDDERPLAFPGAEGFGKYVTGGRGGKVLIVTNLNDAGPGSLREAAEAKGPRIIVFEVAGTIHLASPLRIRGEATLAGQTAPGDGICLADQPVLLGGDNIIVRYLRFRMGDRYQNKGRIPGSGHDDAFSAYKRNHIIIDHCSMSWSTDEVCSVYGGDSVTLQWNIISEPLNYSYHFEAGDTDYQRHGYGGILGGKHISIHHNLYAHCQSRTPRFDGNRNLQSDVELADFRNNVIYNWGSNNVYGGEGGRYNIVNNYYRHGPSTSKNTRQRIVNPFKRENSIPFGKFFVGGNFVEGSAEVTANNWLGVAMDKGTEEDANLARMAEPISAAPLVMEEAMQAFELVLQNAGASFRRDTLDERIVNDVINSTGRIIDVQGGFAHGTAYERTSGAWPSLKTGPIPADKDRDGMPDEWELRSGLNPSDHSDASAYKLSKRYTNIEVYINAIAK